MTIQDSVKHTILVDVDLKCATTLAEEVGGKAEVEAAITKNRNQLVTVSCYHQ